MGYSPRTGASFPARKSYAKYQIKKKLLAYYANEELRKKYKLRTSRDRFKPGRIVLHNQSTSSCGIQSTLDIKSIIDVLLKPVTISHYNRIVSTGFIFSKTPKYVYDNITSYVSSVTGDHLTEQIPLSNF